MRRQLLTAVAIVAALVGVSALPTLAFGDGPPPQQGPVVVVDDAGVREYGYGLIRFNGRGPEWWRWQAVLERRRAKASRAELRRRWQPTVFHAIAVASLAYRVDHATLVRKARCETGGTFSPFAANPRSSARGLFQFLTRGRVRHYLGHWSNGGTWATTPYWRFSPFDPYASALAAAWMHAVGRAGEFECR